MVKLRNLTSDFCVSEQDSVLREGMSISNLDGRLWEEVGAGVGRYFGDEAMVRARVGIETRYLIALSKVGVVRKLSADEEKTLLSLHTKITPETYGEVRKIEAISRHDVIAMTKIMQQLLASQNSIKDILDHGWVHWGLTSEDVDNLARTALLRDFIKDICCPKFTELLNVITELVDKNKEIIIPSKTHLQPAIPTTLGKEIALFGIRLGEQMVEVSQFIFRGKLTGTVGNLSAHKISFPKIDWRKFSQEFVESLGFEANLYTTQIEPRSRLVGLFQKFQLINAILVDLSQDMRLMIGFEWLVQEAKKEEFGSSAMPQKVNPIDFENAHGNALLSNWIFEGLSRQLPVSWLQRDLVDKTITRNLGLPFGYSLIAIVSSAKGLKRISPNQEKIKHDLESDWSIISEGLQTYLRSMGKGDAYDTLRELSRGRQILPEDMSKWIDKLEVDKTTKNGLRKITPTAYVGYAKENATEMIIKIKNMTSKIVSL